MDLNKSYQDLHNKIFTDVELILIDPNESISIHVHKNILAFSSDYFYGLFTVGNEKNKSISIHVHKNILAFFI